MSLLIDIFEGRDVATADVTGAFLLSEMKDFVIIQIVGESPELLCQVNPTFRKFLTEEKGKKVLYVRLIKALYGCMQSAILWCKTFVGKLQTMGFSKL